MSAPIRVLELRSVRGTGGGPEKTILLGAAKVPHQAARITVCYIRDQRDRIFGIDRWAASLPIDYVEVRERHSFDPSIWKDLLALVRSREIDIVHAHDYKTAAIALLLARRSGVVPVLTEHGWTGQAWRERNIYYPADKRLARRFPQVIAVSEEIRQHLLQHGSRADRVTTVLNGIDHEAFRRDPVRRDPVRQALGLRPDQFVIGSVGRLERQKRVDLLLAAFRRLKTIHPEARLVIAGDGGCRIDLEAMAHRFGVQDSCSFLGHRTDIAELHHAFDLYVQASDYEGTPNAVLEAMALETPVVATDAGGTRQLIENGVHGLLVPIGEAGPIADGMLHALSQPAERHAWAAAARARVERELSFDARTARILGIYADLMMGRGVTPQAGASDEMIETAPVSESRPGA